MSAIQRPASSPASPATPAPTTIVRGDHSRLVPHVLRVEEHEGVGGPRDDRHREADHDDHQQPPAEPRSDRTEDGYRVVTGRLGHGEPVGLGHPPGDDRHQQQGHHRQPDHTTESEGPRRQTVDDGGETDTDPVARGHQCDRLGPVRRRRLLGRHDLGQCVGGTQERAAQGEDDDEPPVARAQGRGHGDGQAHRDGRQQHRPPTESVGEARQGQRQQRRETDDGEPEPKHGARQPGLVGDAGTVGDMAEVTGDVTQGGHHTGSPEPGGEGGEYHAQHHAVVPGVQPEHRRRPGRTRHGIGGRGGGPATGRFTMPVGDHGPKCAPGRAPPVGHTGSDDRCRHTRTPAAVRSSDPQRVSTQICRVHTLVNGRF